MHLDLLAAVSVGGCGVVLPDDPVGCWIDFNDGGPVALKQDVAVFQLMQIMEGPDFGFPTDVAVGIDDRDSTFG